MGGAALLSSTFSSIPLLNPCTSSSPAPSQLRQFLKFSPKLFTQAGSRSSPRSSSLAHEEAALDSTADSSLAPSSPSRPRLTLSKIDKTGRFCSPRAARELALITTYAACLEGTDPVRLFERRLNARREPGYEFNKMSLLDYNHMSFGGPPITVDTTEEADKLLHDCDKESAIETAVLSAPPKLVYSKLILRFTRSLLVAVVDRWDSHVLVIDKVVPSNWKNEPNGRILELCILHLAMSEITEIKTRHQIVINEHLVLSMDVSEPLSGILKEVM
ncbi:uncharacterized protein LOC131149277 isoform X2 [Malania oleifera]|uniref:uncharacterized protein LOC131149277 isoform X2 n=1 Tax=Malania oleifera TaxID=397392 RepID=UPI0025AE50C4|nr:uncharacterized protein LOC131149277 isoform X2 [Malania oleifera]